ncbi:MAG: 50S ribosomal protein L32 [bacterium]|nr:50S ribosomal protein L32 [bacterium]
MPVPRRRHGKGRRDRSRTHKLIKARVISKCGHCGAPKLAHRICPACGYYGDRPYRTIVNA